MKPRRLKLEPLETRTLLATLGGPWPSPRELTLSFAPDGTQIGLFQSDLFAALGHRRDTAAWQTDVLRALQTWAAVADIDIGLVRDTGRPFGAAGLTQGDPRFGDIRLGAFPQLHTIASTVPYLPVSGSWSGDVLLNSSYAAGLQSAEIDLYSAMLNEAGNVLGLADNDDPASAMYTDYLGPRTGLSPADVAAIQSLYGERQADRYESNGGNDAPTTATLLPTTLTGGATTVAIDADLHRGDDVDYFRVPAIGNGGRITARLVAAGESLLVGRLELLRGDGALLASSSAASPLANNASASATITAFDGDMLIRVAGDPSDVFGIGRYRLEVTLRPDSALTLPSADTTSNDPPVAQLPPNAQARWYPAVAGYLDDEVGTNDSIATATALETPLGYVSHSRYEAVGSIRAADDADLYRIVAPDTGDRRLTVHLDTFDVRLLDFEVGLYDADGNVVAEQTAPQADGRVVLDVSDIAASQAYYLRIAAGGPGGSNLGNYVVVAEFTSDDPTLVPLASGVLTDAAQCDTQLWHANRTLLYRFDLRVDGGVSPSAARFEIVDDLGRAVATLVAPSGVTTTQYVWLPAGSFEFAIQPDSASADGFPPMSYTLLAAALSDDVGPGLVDSTERPLPGDANGSGVVDRGDIAAVAADFGQFADSLPSQADFDGDGDVDLADLITVVNNLGRALLPDLSTSSTTTTDGGSTTETAAPSAIVRFVARPTAAQPTVAQPANDAAKPTNLAVSAIASKTRRMSHSPRAELSGLAASATRRVLPRLADAALVADSPDTTISPLAAARRGRLGRQG